VEKTEEYQTKEVPAEIEKAEEDEGIHVVTSPIPGTFYRSPAPGEEAFVEIGDKIKIGDVLCIVEAMKVMNKIESEISGEIVEFLIEDSHTVEYGTKLLKIKQF
jgi:acetyl-CoA carboxylase biotin carboxyl carrier protein